MLAGHLGLTWSSELSALADAEVYASILAVYVKFRTNGFGVKSKGPTWISALPVADEMLNEKIAAFWVACFWKQLWWEEASRPPLVRLLLEGRQAHRRIPELYTIRERIYNDACTLFIRRPTPVNSLGIYPFYRQYFTARHEGLAWFASAPVKEIMKKKIISSGVFRCFYFSYISVRQTQWEEGQVAMGIRRMRQDQRLGRSMLALLRWLLGQKEGKKEGAYGMRITRRI